MIKLGRQTTTPCRITPAARRMRARANAILAVALVAACDGDRVAAPPAAVASAPESMVSLSVSATSDRAILIALYDATSGPNWINNDNWLTNAPLGEWYGVTVDGGRVATLDLEDNRLSGIIPAALGGLSALVHLDFSGNELSGLIPPELGNLTNLGTLWLAGNELTGPIPPELGNLTNLWQVSFGGNSLSGTIPPELGKLASLSTAFLHDNALTGPVPPELGDLASLWELYISGNSLTGTIPVTFQRLSELEWFHYGDNAGLCLPAELLAWYQALTEGIGPVCPDRAVLEAMYATAGGEGWTNADGWLGDDPLGEWYGVTVDSSGFVSTLDLAGNGLSGRLTGRLGELAGLTALRIGDNALSGRLPPSLSRTPLRELRYANTDLCVSAEPWFQWFREWLAGISQHEGTGVRCPPMTDREILTALYEAADGPNWDESRNWLTDVPLREWDGVETNADGRVTTLDLRWNGLKGPIPPELGGLTELETLILFANELSGPIPPALGNLSEAKLIVLAANQLEGAIPSEFGGLTALEELFVNGNRLTSVPPQLGELDRLRWLDLDFNQLTSVPSTIGGLARLQKLNLNFNELTSVPAEVGDLTRLRYLGLWSNKLTSIPPELGNLGSLEELDLDENQLTSVPAELGRLENLVVLWIGGNNLTSIPSRLGALDNLELLNLSDNRLTEIPVERSGYAALEILDLSSNEFTVFPRQLSELANLRELELDGNRLTDIPPVLGGAVAAGRIAPNPGAVPAPAPRRSESSNPQQLDPAGNEWTLVPRTRGRVRLARADFGRDGYRLTDGYRSADGRPRTGGFAGLEILDLSSNEFSGPLPAGLIQFKSLTSLGLADNAALTGALPLGLTSLKDLEDLHTSGTDLCAPADPEFVDWLDGVTRQRVALCDPGGGAAAYLTQAVQSRRFPVPLVADEPALLRVFLNAKRETGAAMPPVRATFYRDGARTHEVNIPARSDPIPTMIDEGSLSKSANAEIPGWVIQPGLEVVIEPDPDGTLDPALGVTSRIPETGRMAVDVRAMPVFEVTLVPFIWTDNPDYSILEITAAMAGDPHGHELFERTHALLPVSGMEAWAHGSVMSSTNDGFEILEQTEMIRVMEGGRGHYLGVMAGPTGPGGLLGVAYGIGSWSSFSVLDAETIAHEFGHNRNLYHAPCGGAGGPDRYYPYGEGNIGTWGYDRESGELVPPSQNDFMSYCEPTWTSDYQFTNALRYRVETESNSIIVTAGARADASSPTLVVWGGLDAEGAPYLRPAFVTDAPPTPPPSAGGPWSLTGRDPSGGVLFSLAFDMAAFTDTDDERAGFTFAVPVTWAGDLASIALEGPGGSAGLDGDTDDPVTILRDRATGQVRGILDGPPPPPSSPIPGLAATQDQEMEVLFSRGIPGAEARRR